MITSVYLEHDSEHNVVGGDIRSKAVNIDFDVVRDYVRLSNASFVGVLTLTLDQARTLADMLNDYLPTDEDVYETLAARDDRY